MAFPLFYGAGTLVSSTSGTTLGPVPYPAGTQAGDIAVLLVGVNNARTISTPDGWAEVIPANSNANLSTAFFWRRLTGDDTQPTVTFDTASSTTNAAGGKIFVFRGCTATGAPFENPTPNGPDGPVQNDNMTTLAMETTGPERFLAAFYIIDNDQLQSDWQSGFPPEWTMLAEEVWNFTGDGTLAAIGRQSPSAETVAAFEIANMEDAEWWRTLVVAFLPEEGAEPTDVVPVGSVVAATTAVAVVTATTEVDPTPTVVAATTVVASVATSAEVDPAPTVVAAHTAVAAVTATTQVNPTGTVVAARTAVANVTGTAWAFPTSVPASAETAVPPGASGDVADDPWIWRNRANPEASFILGSNKSTGPDGGVYTYTLTGALAPVTHWLIGAVNSVDGRDLGYAEYVGLVDPEWGGRVLVVASERNDERLVYGWLNRSTGQITTAGATSLPFEPYGCTLYVSRSTGKVYAFVSEATGGDNALRQYELSVSGDTVTGTQVRVLDTDSLSEGMVTWEPEAWFFLSEEDEGLYRYDAEPDGGTSRVTVDEVGGGNLVADVENVAIAAPYRGQPGYIVVSSQGANRFAVYELAAPHRHVANFAVTAANGVDAVSGTDGLDLVREPFGALWPHGLFVAHDEANSGASASNFKLVDAGAIFGELPPPPTVNPTATVVAAVAGIATVTATTEVDPAGTVVQARTAVANVGAVTTVDVDPIPTVVAAHTAVATVTATTEVDPTGTVVAAHTAVAAVTATGQVAPAATVVAARTAIAAVTATTQVDPIATVVAARAATANVGAVTTVDVDPIPTVVAASTGVAVVTATTEVGPTAAVVAAHTAVGDVISGAAVIPVTATVAAATGVATVTATTDVDPAPTVAAAVAGTASVTATAQLNPAPTVVAAVCAVAAVSLNIALDRWFATTYRERSYATPYRRHT